jgi:hypothetical protein
MRLYAGLRIIFSPGRLPPVRFSGRAVIGDKVFIAEFGGGGIIYEAVGLIALCVMGSRKSGRA